MPLSDLETELLTALKMMLQAWHNGIDPNSEARHRAELAIRKADAKRREEG